MARTKDKASDTVDQPVLGAEGDTCEECGSVLATDQRYCINCGASRAEPRLDFTKHLGAASDAAPEANDGVRTPAAQWSPVAAVGAIAVLGVMLLLGVLIGKDDNEQTVATAPATTTATTPAATTPTATTPATAAPPPPDAVPDQANAKGPDQATTPVAPGANPNAPAGGSKGVATGGD